MKKYIKNIILGILSISFVSCTDVLDKNPLDQISSPTFWKDQSQADLALAGVYARLYNNAFNHESMDWDIFGGDANFSDLTNPFQKIAQGFIASTTGGAISSIYSQSYQSITSCNFFLENIEKVPITDNVKNKYKGEVRFLRALFYFTLTDFYGGVPLYTKLVTIDEAKVKQSTKAEVIAQIIADLDFAIANLPNTAYTGHAVKGSALALKAKVLLHNQQWQGAADAANQIIQDGKFSLYGNYRNLFLAVGQDNNPEIIFSTKYLNPDRSSGLDTRYQLWASMNPRNEFVDEFECTDGLPITTSPLYDAADRKKNRDPRLALTVKTFAEPAITSSGKVINYSYNASSTTGWEPIKWCNQDAMPVDNSTKSENDWILSRYAEVLLIFAEAKNEVSGPDISVYNAINTVRARPGIGMPPIPTGLSKDQMRTRIMHERRVEFGLEAKRYGDMKRWKTAEIYFPTLVDPGGIRHTFDPTKHYLFPFPQSEIDINPNLVQNPGY
jgi:hypothetical protein